MFAESAYLPPSLTFKTVYRTRCNLYGSAFVIALSMTIGLFALFLSLIRGRCSCGNFSTVASKTVEKSDLILLPPQTVLSPSFLSPRVGW